MMEVERAKGWVRERLRSGEARGELPGLIEAAWARALETRLDVLLPRAAVDGVVEALLEPKRLVSILRPHVRAGLRYQVARAQKDERALGTWVPEDARAAIERIVTRPGFVDEAWVRAVFKEEAIEAILADSLYKALRDFSTIIPRLVSSHLPTGGRLGKLAGAASIVERVAEELERRIEPEIKSFIANKSKAVLERAADFAVQHLDDPSSIKLRKNILAFVLSKPPAFHARSVNADVLRELDAAVERIAAAAALDPRTREEVKALLDTVAANAGAKPVREVFAALEIDPQPDFRAWAEAAWPFVELFLNSGAGSAWLDQLVEGALAAASGAPASPATPADPSSGTTPA